MRASKWGHKEVVELLLAAKANPNIKDKVFFILFFDNRIFCVWATKK